MIVKQYLALFTVLAAALSHGATYRVPLPTALSALEKLASFQLREPGLAVKTNGDLEFAYALPKELLGDSPELKAGFYSTLPATKGGNSFPVRGIVVAEACTWPFEKASNNVDCPSLRSPEDPRVVTIANGRCNWLPDQRGVRCSIAYGNFAEILGDAPAKKYLEKTHSNNPMTLLAYNAISNHFYNDPAGEVTIEFP